LVSLLRLVSVLLLLFLLRLIPVLRLVLLLRLIPVLRLIPRTSLIPGLPLVPGVSLVSGPRLPEPLAGNRRQLPDRMHGIRPPALRAHRSYLTISHRIIVLSRPPSGKSFAEEVPG
jgi:hypothetical protein